MMGSLGSRLGSVAFDLLFFLSAQRLLASVATKVIINPRSCSLWTSISLSKIQSDIPVERPLSGV